MKNKKISEEKILIILIIILSILYIVEICVYSHKSTKSITNNKELTSENITNTDENYETVQKRTIENTLSSSGQVESALDEKLPLHASYYFEELLVEENELISEGDNIIEYTNGTYLTAPYDCVLISSSLPDEDEICTTSHYVEVKSLYSLSMSLNISESDINKVEIGDEATITLTSSEETVTGKITAISEVGSYSSSGSYFSSTVSFINNGNIKIGMSATCEVIIEKAEDVLTVSADAIQKSDKGNYVIVQNDDGTTENVYVETGIESDDYIEIKSGLTENQKVFVNESDSDESSGGFSFPGGSQGGGSGFDMKMPSGDMMSGGNGGGSQPSFPGMN